jgi:hypothetical protein
MSTPYPDRTTDMLFLQSVVEKLIEEENYELANLNYAKLMEAMRQQNINLGYALNDVYENSMNLYDSFRLEHGLTYPIEFDPNQRDSNFGKS